MSNLTIDANLRDCLRQPLAHIDSVAERDDVLDAELNDVEPPARFADSEVHLFPLEAWFFGDPQTALELGITDDELLEGEQIEQRDLQALLERLSGLPSMASLGQQSTVAGWLL